MGVVFSPGQILGRGDLDLFLAEDESGVPVPMRAETIRFDVLFVEPDTYGEILIHSGTPFTPAVGEYYIPLQVPHLATSGDYRVRWSINGTQQVVQEFSVT